MSQESSNLNDPDMKGSLEALKRAAKRARLIAAQTGTEIVVRRDGKLIREYPKMSEFEEVKQLTEQDRAESAAESTNKQSIQKMNYKDIITIEPGKRSGKPCIRGCALPSPMFLSASRRECRMKTSYPTSQI